ncbi:hypothetical protein [Schnuerera sp.]|uniref:hypothetical protein n=1 Tax=Schnuerera sp. TaxID=2794844 RepID=UPI002BA8AC48|nr:hypothetical protein [Schnuerera sp.]HSH36897.1 hypothetical protein [Schnuerera sp.]
MIKKMITVTINEISSSEILQPFKDYLIADGKGEKTVVSYVGDICPISQRYRVPPDFCRNLLTR